MQADYTQADTTAVDYIKNKPDINAMIAAALLAVMPVETQTGNPCTFDRDIATALVSLIVDIVSSGGGGTPSTPIPIVGHSALNLDVNGDTFTVQFGQTVYGGVLDVTRGKLHVTHGYVELTDVNFTNFVAVSKMVYGAFPEGTKPATANDKANILCSHYKTVSRAEVGYSAPYTVTGIGIDTGGNIFVTSPASTWASVSDAIADFSGVYMAYELATPFDIDLTPVQIRALVGENNVFADCGKTEVEYLAEG